MKRNVLVVILCLGIGAILWRTFPRSISLSLKGVEYQLGSPTQKAVKPITLKLEGTRYTSLFGKHSFTGFITIEGPAIPNNGTVEIEIHSYVSGAPIAYLDGHSNKFHTVGVMFNNSRFNEFTIEVFQPDVQGWNSGDGLMISAPAQTRAQALQISNDLMKSRLPAGYPLK